MGSRITKRQIRGRIFGLRSILKQYVRESGAHNIQKELMILQNLTRQVFIELEKEQTDG